LGPRLSLSSRGGRSRPAGAGGPPERRCEEGQRGAGEISRTMADGSSQTSKVDFKIHAELLRLITYVMFWVMVLVSIFVTKVFVKPDLTDTPLVHTLGYNNICIYFDHSPAREVAAAIYPFVEIPLVAYVILNFLTTREFWQVGRISGALYRVYQLTLPVEFVLAVLFRMVFVIDGFQNIQGHTIGFLGLQLLLCLISTKNLLVDRELGETPGRGLVGQKAARVLAILYVLLLCVSSALKIIHTAALLFTGSGIFDVTTSGGVAIAKTLDYMWMVLAAVIPALIAFQQMRSTLALNSLTVTIELPVPSAVEP